MTDVFRKLEAAMEERIARLTDGQHLDWRNLKDWARRTRWNWNHTPEGTPERIKAYREYEARCAALEEWERTHDFPRCPIIDASAARSLARGWHEEPMLRTGQHAIN